MPRTVIGCDLSRAVLDLYSLPDAASTQVVNDPDDRRLCGGRRKIREALYIAVLTASRRVPSFVTMRDRMRERGKAPKTILIAVARRLLVIITACCATERRSQHARTTQLPASNIFLRAASSRL